MSETIQKIGRGQYVHAPSLAAKLKSPTWQANAAINNPGVPASAVVLTGATGSQRKKAEAKRTPAQRRKTDLAAGAAAGGAAGLAAEHGTFYGLKHYNENSKASDAFLKPNAKGQRVHYGEHRKKLDKLKSESRRVAGHGNIREATDYFNRNFPKDVPTSKTRRMSAAMGRKTKAGFIATGATAGLAAASHHNRKKEHVGKSAFDIEHISKASGSRDYRENVSAVTQRRDKATANNKRASYTTSGAVLTASFMPRDVAHRVARDTGLHTQQLGHKIAATKKGEKVGQRVVNLGRSVAQGGADRGRLVALGAGGAAAGAFLGNSARHQALANRKARKWNAGAAEKGYRQRIKVRSHRYAGQVG